MAGTITTTRAEHRPRGVAKIRVNITCDATGNATANIIGVSFGKLMAVGYRPGTFATGVNITLSNENGVTLFALASAGTAARYIRPSADITSDAGVAITDATATPDTNRDIYVGGRLRVAVTGGGNLGSGGIDLVIDETVIHHSHY